MAAPSFSSSALVGMSLAVFLIEKLVNKSVLTASEVSELADAALLKLEEWQVAFPQNQGDFEEARQVLDDLVRDYRKSD
jgi:hypothetical protein